MKSEMTEPDSEKPKYPKLMITRQGDVVFFSKEGFGMVVYGPFGRNEFKDRYNEGYYCESWVMDRFKDFNGTIKLSNS